MLFLYLILGLILNPTRIYINLEKPNDIIIHAGITLRNDEKEVRYDFRAFNDGRDYITTEESRKSMSEMFPDLDKDFLKAKGLGDDMVFIYTKEIYLGTSNYSMEEIMEMERGLSKKYILAVYDCRHYVNELCKLSLDKEIPIWDLESLIKE
tara:strand:+ start:6119 stop:6574 length:456 start_codon:yes stop_codon:yes gene_type:complete